MRAGWLDECPWEALRDFRGRLEGICNRTELDLKVEQLQLLSKAQHGFRRPCYLLGARPD